MTQNLFHGYIGTYTKGDSEGIYSFTLDTAAGKIGHVQTAAKLDNPTYLTISSDNRYVYAVVKQGDEGGVSSYTLQDGTLTALNTQTSAGSPPCHISTDKENTTVVTANYHKGTIESYLVQEDGSVSPAVSVMEHAGSGPDPRQEKPHAHYAGFTPDGQYVVAVDLGTDTVFSYRSYNGNLTEASRFSVKPGSGPRHIVFHPNGTYAYIMTEFGSTVIAVSYNPADGSFTEKQYVSTLPADFTANNQGSAIHISADGRFVYAGNRGHDSIAVFSVNQDSGELTFVEHVSTEGHWPRDFVLDPTEQFVIAANQESSNLVLFARDAETGKLRLLQSDVQVPDPVCVKFLHV
ncbi:lactonase family protein [Ectobacillus ponti]|uniref:Lactonase family protein n=1 Tax=Ectobacillus ponti TaxID=2961894 RepID=A0AA42BPQ5_9BACI|nr:lactonase family protein [Ectobacillus ponti]MCP8969400.1 lactonase family protein [Ectobacillus ponti]